MRLRSALAVLVSTSTTSLIPVRLATCNVNLKRLGVLL